MNAPFSALQTRVVIAFSADSTTVPTFLTRESPAGAAPVAPVFYP